MVIKGLLNTSRRVIVKETRGKNELEIEKEIELIELCVSIANWNHRRCGCEGKKLNQCNREIKKLIRKLENMILQNRGFLRWELVFKRRKNK